MEANRYLLPATLEEAHQLLLQDAKNILLGGGLWLKKSTSSANALIDLSALGLDQIKDTGDHIEVGAMVSLRDFEMSLLWASPFAMARPSAVPSLENFPFPM